MLNTLLDFLTRTACRRPIPVIAASLLLALSATLYSAMSLRINSNPDDLVAKDRPYQVAYRDFVSEFGDLEYIYIVVVDNGDGSRSQACIDVLSERLRGIAELTGVYGSVSAAEQLRVATRAMPTQDLRDFAAAASAFPTLLSQGGPGEALATGTSMLERLGTTALSLSNDERRELGAGAMLLLKTVAAAADTESRAELARLLPDLMPRQYLRSESGKLFFLRISPVKDYGTLAVVEKPLEQIRAVIAEVGKEFPGVEIGLTGKQVLLADQMVTTSRDMTKASIISTFFVAIVFMIMTGSVWRPAAAVLCLLFGIAWTFGVTTLVLGEMNLFSTVFMPVLIGIGDFSVYLIIRYDEERRRFGVEESLRRAMFTTTPGNLTACMTSSAAFFVTMLTEFKALRELGFIAGTGLVLCLVASLVTLPAFLVVLDRRATRARLFPWRPFESHCGAPNEGIARPVLILAICALLTLALFPAIGNVRFEDNLLELQAEGLESVAWENRILEDSNHTTLFGVITADSLDEVARVIALAQQKPALGTVHSVFDVIAPDSAERTQLRARLHPPPGAALPQVHASPWGPPELERAAAAVHRVAALAALQAPREAERMERVGHALRELALRLYNEPAEVARQTREQIGHFVSQTGQSLATMLAGDRLGLRESLPDAARDMFVSPGGRFAVMLHPRKNVWAMDALVDFVADLRAIDPDATGFPVNHMEILAEMKRSARQVFLLALVTVVLLVWLDFRDLKDTILAVAPLLAALVGTFEAMGLLRIDFNIVNFISAPLLVGIGVDYGVHIIHRYREGGEKSSELGSTPRAVVLTALTTLIGFGSLLTAQHLGARSFGALMVVGGIACLVASLLILPNLLVVIQHVRRARSCQPREFSQTAPSVGK